MKNFMLSVSQFTKAIPLTNLSKQSQTIPLSIPNSNLTKILILTPDLRGVCGVSNYYNTLQLEQSEFVAEYFYVNTIRKEGKYGTLKRLAKNYIRFYRKLVNENFTLVHLNPSFNKRSFLRDAVFCCLAQLLKKKTVILFHGWDNTFEENLKKSVPYKFIFKHIYKKNKNFVVLSSLFQQKLLQLGIEPSFSRFWIETTVAVKPLHFNLEKKIQTFQTAINIVFIARMLESKGIYIALDAFKTASESLPDKQLKFLVAGDGKDLPSVKQYAKEKNIQNVEFLGYIVGKQKNELLNESHILLFPTYYPEGLPTTVLEGMAYGMPVLSRYNAGITDVVDHEVNGFLTDSTDPDVFANFLVLIINNPQLYSQMAKTNYQKALKTFTCDIVKTRVLNIYKQLQEDTIHKLGGN